jgi:phospholipase/carboxylesterase
VKPGTYVISRREVIGAGIAGIGSVIFSACSGQKSFTAPAIDLDPLVTVKVTSPTGTVATGLTVPFSAGSEECFMYVPAGYQASTPVPLVLMFHGEAQSSYQAIQTFQPHADAAGIALLAIDSGGTTWDIFADGVYGPDVEFMNVCLTAVFKVLNVDATRLTVEGFSDGASYALAVGRANGNFFSHVIACSAALAPGVTPVGKPAIFLAHGIQDPTFDIQSTGDAIDAKLVADGYTVDYVRFTGVHEFPDAIVQQAIAWLATS